MGEQRRASEQSRYQDVLRRLALLDEGVFRDEAGVVLMPAGRAPLDARTTALVQLAAAAGIGSSGVCMEWLAARALAAGASTDDIVEVLLAITPVTGMCRTVGAAARVAAALDYDLAGALEDPGDV